MRCLLNRFLTFLLQSMSGSLKLVNQLEIGNNQINCVVCTQLLQNDDKKASSHGLASGLTYWGRSLK
jgi:hypothetical protein